MIRRNRILRRSDAIRQLVQETTLTPHDFIVPMFVIEGSGIKEEILSMPNYYRFSLDLAVKEAKELWQMGLKSVLLFVKVPDELKDNAGKESKKGNKMAYKEYIPAISKMQGFLDQYEDQFKGRSMIFFIPV